MSEQNLGPAAILLLQSKVKKPFELTLSGISMLPILHDGDTLSICSKDDYEIGDILVFVYKNGEILAHRLLKIENGRYYLKGDNSFRMEDVSKEQIAGAVYLENDSHRTPEFLNASYQMNRVFRRCKYSIEETMKTKEYRLYKQTYLEEPMTYIRNDIMEFLEVDDEHLAVYDNESGDTHYIEGTGKVILEILKEKITEEELISKLTELYDAPTEEIRDDVHIFISELVQKKVVLCC